LPAGLKVDQLRKRYGPVEALKGVSFQVGAGEILGLLGPNGAGKTTAVESIAGLREPDSGSIEISGIDARRRPHEARRHIGMALAATALQDKITPREAIESFGAFYSRRAPAQDLIDRFELRDVADRYFEGLSTGQRQRLALALALVNKPETLILDEPSAGLDTEARRRMHATILDIRRSGGAVLMTTHDMDEAERLCDRVAIIHLGQVVAEGSPADLTARSRTSTTISLRTQPAISPAALEQIKSMSALVRIEGAGEPETEGNLTRFTVSNVNTALEQLAPILNRHGIDISELHAQKATLDEVVAGFL
jgi:ABC-2 type transport system ATP-binding protein